MDGVKHFAGLTRSRNAERMTVELFAHLRQVAAHSHPGEVQQVQCAFGYALQQIIHTVAATHALGDADFLGSIGLGIGHGLRGLSSAQRAKAVTTILEGIQASWDIQDAAAAEERAKAVIQ